jgi:tRNA pseudouridine38-40 synthase
MSDVSHRWRLDIAYDGSDFSGWATQPGRRTVQGELEHWIAQVLRLGEPAGLTCAGRTDAGVHARGQVAHTDLPVHPGEQASVLLRRLARVLRGDVVVRNAVLAPPGFDARFSAVWRRYVYRLWDAGTPPDPLLRHHVAAVRGGPLDLGALNGAAEGLLGLRDFAAFCRRRTGATTIRTLQSLEAVRVETGPLAGVVEVTVQADAFCHSMVRALVGGLVAVGTGRRDPDWLWTAASSGQRDPGIELMPAHGLTLEEVGYPSASELGRRALEARARREPPL